MNYNREVAEKFGWDTYISILCGSDPDKLVKHIDDAARLARIAFHFARYVLDGLEVV